MSATQTFTSTFSQLLFRKFEILSPYRDGTGIVEYARADDVKYAIRKLDDTKFRSHEVRRTLSVFCWGNRCVST